MKRRAKGIEIRECATVEALSGCVLLQRSVFALPEVEISPVRHFIVSKNAGGFTLGAFDGARLVGFVLSIPAFLRGQKAFYSHMAAIDRDYQGRGIGAALKWKQRLRALSAGVGVVKWTFQPVQARNAYFNLEKLGAIVPEYRQDFYGTDYAVSPDQPPALGIESDRLFAEWHLKSEKVCCLADGLVHIEPEPPVRTIVTTNDWSRMVKKDPKRAKSLQRRIRREFRKAFSDGLVCRGFRRSESSPEFLLFSLRGRPDRVA